MYFTNLTNTELEHFKGIKIQPMKMLSNHNNTFNNLFVKDNAGTACRRKIALFNCDGIRSCDDSNVVLENKGFLHDMHSDGLSHYICFENVDDDLPLVYAHWDDYPSFYTLGDSLSTEEFNAFIQLIKHGKSFTDTIELDKPETYKYGQYSFDIKGQVIDKGFLVTDTTLDNDNYITLSGNVFENSSYNLTLKVMRISDVNLLDVYENIEYKAITISLTPDVPTLIPLTNVNENDVILFDAEVNINHDKPVIHFSKILDLTVTGTWYVGDTHTLSVTFTENNTPLTSKTIKFYDGTTLLGTATTDSNGEASITHTIGYHKIYEFRAECELYNVESNIIRKQTVYKRPTLSVDGKTSVKYGEASTITGTLSYDGTGINAATIKLYDRGIQIDSTTTNSNGEYTFNLANTTVGNRNYIVAYEGNVSPYATTLRETFVLNIRKINTVFNASISRSATSNTFTITGTLTDEDGNIMANKPLSIEVKYGEYSYSRSGFSTNSNGEFTTSGDNIMNFAGVATLSILYAGTTGQYNSAEQTFNVISKINTKFVNITRRKEGNQYFYNGRLVDHDDNPITDKNVIGTIGSEEQSILTGHDGGFVFVRAISTSFSVVFEEDDTYIGCTGAL